MRYVIRTTLLGAFLLAGSTTASAQTCQIASNLVANCSFEMGPTTSGPTYQFLSTLTGWNSIGGRFERWTNGFDNNTNVFPSKDGVAHLELDSDVGNTTIWQNIATTTGANYTVSFWAAHRSLDGQYSQLGVQIDNSTIFTTPQLTDNNPGQFQWVKYTTTFTAASALTKLAFAGVGPSNTYGDHLDNIAVVSTVPEPSTYALMGAGLAGLFGVARRRRRTV